MRPSHDRIHPHHDSRRRAYEARARGPRPGGDWGLGPGFAGNPFAGEFFGGRRPHPARARRGDVRVAILSLLAEGPSSGYALIQGIRERSEGLWRPSPGSVYPTLQQLVDEELIAPTGDEGRRTEYALTDAGTTWITEHAEQVERAWRVEPDVRAQQEELRAYREASAKLARVIAQLPGDASPAQRAAAVEKIDELRKALYAILAE